METATKNKTYNKIMSGMHKLRRPIRTKNLAKKLNMEPAEITEKLNDLRKSGKIKYTMITEEPKKQGTNSTKYGWIIQ